MDEGDPTEVVRELIARLNAKDVDGYAGLCADDVELRSPLAGLEGANVGQDGVREFFERIIESTEHFNVDIRDLERLDDTRVLATVGLHVRSTLGIEMDREMSNLYEVEDGRLRRVEAFPERAAALRAAGIEP